MSDLTDKVFKTIEKEKITPESHWHFLLKSFLIWLLLTILLIIGAMSISTSIFMLARRDWDVYQYLNESFAQYLFISIPYIWLAVFVLFAAGAYFTFKKTPRGYRFGTLFTAAASIFLSIGLGLAFFLAGLESQVHETLSGQMPYYDSLVNDPDDVWHNPERGLLGGEIVKVSGPDDFAVMDIDDDVWLVRGEHLVWFDPTMPKEGVRVKMIGRLGGSGIFIARIVKPWDCCR